MKVRIIFIQTRKGLLCTYKRSREIEVDLDPLPTLMMRNMVGLARAPHLSLCCLIKMRMGCNLALAVDRLMLCCFLLHAIITLSLSLPSLSHVLTLLLESYLIYTIYFQLYLSNSLHFKSSVIVAFDLFTTQIFDRKNSRYS